MKRFWELWLIAIVIFWIIVATILAGCAYTGMGPDEALEHMRAANMARAAKEKASLRDGAWSCEPTGDSFVCRKSRSSNFDPTVEDIYKIDFEEWNLYRQDCLFYSIFSLKDGYNTISIWRDGIVLINGRNKMGLDTEDVSSIRHLFRYIYYRHYAENF